MLFADAGLSTAEISSLFAIWSLTAVVLEVPSGVWADAVSRRALLVLAPLLSGAGFALWVLAPSYEAFAIGFVLWGAQGALQSGAFEALAYEELERAGAADRYAQVIGRATACGTIAAGAAMGLAAPAFAAGGYGAVGGASVVACAAAALVAATLPEHRQARRTRAADPAGAARAHAGIVRAGLLAVRASPALRGALLLVPAVAAIWGSLDEYLPLLAVESGVAIADVPAIGLLIYAAMALGGALAGRVSTLAPRLLALVLAGAACALALGALARVPAGFAAVALAFCAFQALTVAVDARLQDAISGDARATVTSLAGLLTELLVIAVFAAYAVGSAHADHATLFALAAAFYVVVAVHWALWRRFAA